MANDNNFGQFTLIKEETITKVIQKFTNTPRTTALVGVFHQSGTDEISFLKATSLKIDGSISELLKPANENPFDKELGASTAYFMQRSRYSRFDGKPLSARTVAFRQQIAELFVRDVLLPEENPDIDLDKEDARLAVALLILEDDINLKHYFDNANDFLDEIVIAENINLPEEHRLELVRASEMRQTAIYSLFDYAELGESAGDGNTYILVGAASDGRPTVEAMLWLQQSLAEFVERYGFLPGYGSYVTEAALRQRVILGPDTTERDLEYIKNNVFDWHDCRYGQSVTDLDLG